MRSGRTLLRGLVVLGITLLAAGPSFNKITAQSPVLTVRADNTSGPISPYVYGVNDGPWATVPPDVMPLAKTSGATYLRFPGGDWGDDFDLTPFQIDMFMTFAQQIHAEPSISVRLKDGTPDVAARLVKYVNVDKKYGVKYWSIGNEPNLYPNYSVDQFNKDWRQFAQAMLAVDPGITLVGPDINQYPPPQDNGYGPLHDWLRSFLKANGDLVGVVSVHRYPFPKQPHDPPTTINQLRESASEWDAIIPDLRQTVQETTGHALPVAVTEVNSHWTHAVGGEASPDSFYNAIWWADVLGDLIRQQVNIVAYFTLFTYGDSGAFGLLGPYSIRPTYYVYQLYQKFGDRLVDSSSTDANVTITAARRSDGALTLMIVNAATEPKAVSLQLSGFSSSGQAELWRLDPQHNAEKIGSTTVLASNTLNLPAQSVSLYIVPPGAL